MLLVNDSQIAEAAPAEFLSKPVLHEKSLFTKTNFRPEISCYSSCSISQFETASLLSSAFHLSQGSLANVSSLKI